jgi:dTDP-4-amino-4,6-dideoxy-D-galactose acyltransferase
MTICAYLEWDSTFFGRRIARINVNHLSPDQADEALAWCAAERSACLYFLADSDNAETVRAAEARGFALVDIRMTLERRGAPPAPSEGIRASRPEDIDSLKAMARVNHRDTRFYYDGHFAQTACDALYETWIERSCNGYADAVLVAEREGQPAGYITCDDHHDYGQIGLLGVGEAWQGQRVGPALIDGALHWFGARGIERVQVVTQGRNVRAQRAYQRCGFVTARAQLWYHRWFGLGNDGSPR